VTARLLRLLGGTTHLEPAVSFEDEPGKCQKKRRIKSPRNKDQHIIYIGNDSILVLVTGPSIAIKTDYKQWLLNLNNFPEAPFILDFAHIEYKDWSNVIGIFCPNMTLTSNLSSFINGRELFGRSLHTVIPDRPDKCNTSIC
jgi:hypothetical protein